MANEKRLIYANELTDRLKHTTMVAYPNLFPGLLAAVEIVDDSPTVDAVEVVRCKDCIHWDSKIGSCDEFTTHRFPAGGRIAFLTRDDDFCSYGERRTDDDGDA